MAILTAPSAAFYAAIGFCPEPNFTDETAAALSFGDSLFIMLLTHAKWKTTNEITDAPKSVQVMVAPSLRDREAVDGSCQFDANPSPHGAPISLK